jgi:hypothetical protein
MGEENKNAGFYLYVKEREGACLQFFPQSHDVHK